MNKVLLGLIASGAILSSSQALAAAFQLAEQNVSGLGRAYAGEASAADDASVVARNPALMGKLSGTQLSVAAMYVQPDVSLTGTGTSNGIPAAALNDNSIAPSAIIPAIYATHKYNDQWSIGAGIYSQFGLSTEFDKDYVAGQIAGETEIKTVNLGISAAYQIDEQWSVAFGINEVYADAKIVRNLGATTTGLPASTQAVHLEGDDYGFGWNLGVAYQIDENNLIGFHYRSETDITFDGHFSNDLPAAIGGLNGASLPGSVDVTLPAIAEISGSHKLNQETSLHYSVLWTGWNSFDELEAVVGNAGSVFTKEENFSNSLRFAVGADYQLSNAVKLRAGMAYDESPADENHLSISIPDTDRTWYSFGAEYTLANQATVDFGISVLRGKTQTFTEADRFSEWGYRSKGHAMIFGLQYNHKF
ncbi:MULTISPECIES: outer membrane protein transport protein [unclassified Pseudoalteromonas]|uniref:outer membrane protein transport protein n=1 Tax=unclassified Pseudoalteromonas TaxID=194690 RepID=UPI002097139A|nr:outer membrane protein transport protein [Pseudoalteromonas sp. OANN1]MCO7200111.1 outer membrane protein transport protein [Pseudoalteromonas sp. OANN1]